MEQQKRRDLKIWRDNPRIKVRHYGGTDEHNLVQKTGRLLATNNKSDVLMLNWQKNVGSPRGGCSMHVVPRQNYLEGKNRIRANDFLVVEVDAGDGSGWVVISYMLVDRISMTTTVDGAGRSHQMMALACSDFGKVLEEMSLIVDPGVRQFGTPVVKAMGLSLSVINNVLKHAKNSAATPNQAVFDIYQLVFQDSAQFVIPNTKTTFTDLVSFDFIQPVMIGAAFISTHLIGLDANAKLWSLLKQYSNEFLNELFVDVRYENPSSNNNGVTTGGNNLAKKINQSLGVGNTTLETDGTEPVVDLQDSNGRAAPLQLIHRQRPYDYDTFKALTAAVVYPSEISHNELGVSSHEVFNIFRVFGLFGGGKVGLAENNVVRSIPASIRRHGSKRFEPETIFMFPSLQAAADQNTGKANADFAKMLKVFTNIISIWNAENDALYAGTVTCRLRTDIRVGQRLVIPQKDNTTIEGYIQALSHHVSADPYQQSNTTLTIVRGLRRKNDSDTTTNLSQLLVIDPSASDTDVRVKYGFSDSDSAAAIGPTNVGDFNGGSNLA